MVDRGKMPKCGAGELLRIRFSIVPIIQLSIFPLRPMCPNLLDVIKIPRQCECPLFILNSQDVD